MTTVVQVNLLGSATTARAFLPALKERGGYLLQIASLAAITAVPMMSDCASKPGVEAFAHCLRAELRHQGVKVGVGYLSWTDTDMVRGADEDDVMRELRSRLPWPSDRTYPLEPAVDRIVAGIERRSAHVYAQWWLRGMQSIRGCLPPLIAAVGSGRCVVWSHASPQRATPAAGWSERVIRPTRRNASGGMREGGTGTVRGGQAPLNCGFT